MAPLTGSVQMSGLRLPGGQRAALRAGKPIPWVKLGSLKLPRNQGSTLPVWVSAAEDLLGGRGAILDDMFGLFP